MSQKIKTPCYPLDDHKKMAKIDECMEFQNEDFKLRFIKVMNLTFLAEATMMPGPTPKEKTDVLDRLDQGFKLIDQRIKVNNGFFVDGEITLADFHIIGYVSSSIHFNFIEITDYPNVDKWWTAMKEIKCVGEHAQLAKKEIKKMKCLMKYMMPVMKCMMCACCKKRPT
jgi:glutathione S-transferase